MNNIYLSDGYFAAANSRNGFISFDSSLFSDVSFLYIIKGGPGTGKSSFMRSIALEALNEGYDVEYIWCSSDPSSLDGLIIRKSDRSIAFWDGTAPHTAELKTPGIDSQFCDLGQFWNTTVLSHHADEIRHISSAKSSCYASAYRLLSSAGSFVDEIADIASEYTLHNKLYNFVKRFTDHLEAVRDGKIRKIFTSCISGYGEIRSAIFENISDNTYFIDEKYRIYPEFFALLADALVNKGYSLDISVSPLDPNMIDGIFVREICTSFVTSHQNDSLTKSNFINSRRFIDNGVFSNSRHRMRELLKLHDAAMSDALHSLEKARNLHTDLEKYYGSAMDFSKLERYKKEIMSKLF